MPDRYRTGDPIPKRPLTAGAGDDLQAVVDAVSQEAHKGLRRAVTRVKTLQAAPDAQFAEAVARFDAGDEAGGLEALATLLRADRALSQGVRAGLVDLGRDVQLLRLLLQAVREGQL